MWASGVNDYASSKLSAQGCHLLDGCLLFESEWWRKIETGVFSLDVIECAANHNLPLPLFGMDVYIQPAWWICQSCVTPALSEIVHLLPCKIALNWGNPSEEAWYRTLIKFTTREKELGARHLHRDAGRSWKSGLWWKSFINILIYQHPCWYCHSVKIALRDSLTMKWLLVAEMQFFILV